MLLKRGQESPDVLNLELVLQGLGFGGFTPDGRFDEKTENVIRYIQTTHGLASDGVVGRNTLELLDRLYEPLVDNFKHKPITEPASVRRIIAVEDNELSDVHPLLADKALDVKAIALSEGYHITVTQGLRTFKEQHTLFLKRPRVTKADAGQSYHNYGVAIDFAFQVKIAGKDALSWDEKLYRNIGRWASRTGLEWGGHWRFVDYPHLQLPNLPATGKMLAIYNKHGLAEVWKQFIK